MNCGVNVLRKKTLKSEIERGNWGGFVYRFTIKIKMMIIVVVVC